MSSTADADTDGDADWADVDGADVNGADSDGADGNDDEQSASFITNLLLFFGILGLSESLRFGKFRPCLIILSYPRFTLGEGLRIVGLPSIKWSEQMKGYLGGH